MATMTMGLLLAVAGVAALPAASASASGSVVAWWTSGGSAYENTYTCAAQDPGPQGRPLEVYNACGTRVWLHYDDAANGRIYTLCVNPGGFLAYGFTDSGGFLAGTSQAVTDIQVTNNTSPCDASESLYIVWLRGSVTSQGYYSCEGQPPITNGGQNVSYATDGCVGRVWLHENENGSGNSLCISPGYSDQPVPPAYQQAQETANQAPCSAGGAPYPY